MPVVRCRHCQLPLTDDEAQSGACPTCGGVLADETAPAAASTSEAVPPRPGLLRRLVVRSLLVVLVAGAGYVYFTWPDSQGEESRGNSDPRRPEVLTVAPQPVRPPLVLPPAPLIPESLTVAPVPVEPPEPVRPPVVVPPPPKLRVQYVCTNTDNKPNQLKFKLRIVNDGDEAVPLAELSLRYWYTRDGNQAQTFVCDWAADFPPRSLVATFRELPRPVRGADGYLELAPPGRAPTLSPGKTSGEIQGRIYRTDWSRYTQPDDYSYNPRAGDWTDAPHVTLYRKGELVWGVEPGDAAARPPLFQFPDPFRPARPGVFNYAEALQKAVYFYDCQRSGKLPATNRVAWRGDSGLDDGADVGIDLTGGWYVDGGHVKFGLPMAASATLLAWSVIEYRDGYAKAGQLEPMLANLRWVCDYLVKCRTGKKEFYAQVGLGQADRAWWGPAEVMPMSRPALKLTADRPGSDVAGETAAALAAASIAFRATDPDYATKLLKQARETYQFAERYRGSYADSLPDAAGFYKPTSGYEDDLVWGALWLYRATRDRDYLETAEAGYARLRAQPGSRFKSYKGTHSWDDKSYGCYVLLAQLTGKEASHEDARRWLDYWTVGFQGERVPYTPGGLAWLDGRGPLRYACNTAFLALVYADGLPDGALAKRYRDFAGAQVRYALGDNPQGRSYVVGFGRNPPQNPHHRTAHGSWANDVATPPLNRNVLYGALVGGPGRDDGYRDERGNAVANEVGCEFNAGFTGALARLVGEYGGAPLPDFPPKPRPEGQIYVEANVKARGPNFTEIRAVLHNHSAAPARAPKNLGFRYYVDLGEVAAQGLKIDDVKVMLNYHQNAVVSDLKPHDARNRIYYVEVRFQGPPPSPVGRLESRREVEFRLSLPASAPRGAWEPANDWSYQNLDAARAPVATEFLPVFEGDRLVGGKVPPGR